MIVDLVVVAAVLAFGIAGRYTGTFRQLAHLSGMALARLIAPPLALLMTLTLARDYGMPPYFARIGLSALCFYGLYFLGTAISRLFMKAPPLHRRISRVDQTGGFILGAAQGAVLLTVMLSLAHLFEGPLIRLVGRPARQLDDSVVFGLVRGHNPFGAPPFSAADRVERLMIAAQDPRAIATDPKVRALLKDPAMKAFLQDEALAQAVKSGDWTRIQKDPRMAALLSDPRLMGSLSDPLDYEPPRF